MNGELSKRNVPRKKRCCTIRKWSKKIFHCTLNDSRRRRWRREKKRLMKFCEETIDLSERIRRIE